MEITKNLFFIERGYLNGNHFVYAGEKPVLIDTAYIGDIRETLKKINEVNVDPSRVRLIVNTHTHCDHIGANHHLQQISGCEVALHEIGKSFIDTKNDWSTWAAYYGQEAKFFDATLPLKDDDILEIGQHPFRVIHLPGHASDQIALYHLAEKFLISSDALWETDMPVITVRIEGNAALFHLRQSLEKLSRLDVKTVYPGHGPPFCDYAKAVSKAQNKVNRYIADPEKLGADLIKRIIVYTLLMYKSFPENRFFDFLLKSCWYRENVDFYFEKSCRDTYDRIMESLLDKNVVKRSDGRLFSTVKP